MHDTKAVAALDAMQCTAPAITALPSALGQAFLFAPSSFEFLQTPVSLSAEACSFPCARAHKEGSTLTPAAARSEFRMADCIMSGEEGRIEKESGFW